MAFIFDILGYGCIALAGYNLYLGIFKTKAFLTFWPTIIIAAVGILLVSLARGLRQHAQEIEDKTIYLKKR